MKNILFVEDSPEVQILVKGILSQYQVYIASSIAEAMNLSKSYTFDLYLIDIGLPDGNGFQLCTSLKSSETTNEIPVIFLTARSEIENKVLGFSMGGDDYIVKPFEPMELVARIENKLRNHMRLQKKDSEIKKGNLILNIPFMKAFAVESNVNIDLDLSPNEFRLLYYFMKNEDSVLSRNQLLDAVWGADANVTDRTVDVHIYTLRKKMSKYANYLESVFGVGYRFSVKRNHDLGVQL